MKIGMMGAWNTASGAGVHAELIGREWVRKGIDLKVFSFYDYSFHGKVFTTPPDKEESYVVRCFTKYGYPHPQLDTEAILKEDFDIFVVEDLGMLPLKKLFSIYPEIRKRTKTVNIIHDGKLSEKSGFFDFDWDHVVCFDERYNGFLKKIYPEETISIIPYPAASLVRGDKIEARKKLGLPQKKKIIFVFGQTAEKAAAIYPVLNRLNKKYDMLLVTVAKVERTIEAFKNVASELKFDLEIIEEAPDIERLYDYLHASDCTVYNKSSDPLVVVGSSIFQCMGSGCPIIALDSNFVHTLDKEVIRYRDEYELERSIIDVFEKGEKYQDQQSAIEAYLQENSAEHIAGKFIELFEKL
ncbi:MAG: hypothetical protein ABH862_03010 [Candidatus Omnitrophota bacterium]